MVASIDSRLERLEIAAGMGRGPRGVVTWRLDGEYALNTKTGQRLRAEQVPQVPGLVTVLETVVASREAAG